MVNNGARSSSQASQPDSNVNGVASRDNSVKPQIPPPPTSASTSKPRQRAPPTTADIVAASVGAKKERKRQVSKEGGEGNDSAARCLCRAKEKIKG